MQSAPVLEFAIATAHAAGELLLEYRGRDLEISTKSSAFDLVTSADRAAEALILERVRERYPQHGVLAEESGLAQTGSGALQWVIDPLDGTTNFAHGIPHFCVSIALEDARGTLLGVVHDPVRGETFSSARGAGAWLETHGRYLQGTRPVALPQSEVAGVGVGAVETADELIVHLFSTPQEGRVRITLPDARVAGPPRLVGGADDAAELDGGQLVVAPQRWPDTPTQIVTMTKA